MEDIQAQRVYIRHSSSLQSLTLSTVALTLVTLNSSELGSDFPWLTEGRNPFAYLSPVVIEEVITATLRLLTLKYDDMEAVNKNIFKFLLCKKLRKFTVLVPLKKAEDVLDVLKMIDSTKSNITWLEVPYVLYDERSGSCSWLHIPEAKSYFRGFLRSLPSLTYLNVNFSCCDEMLEIIGDCCPNLVVLLADKSEITGKGLKRLCINSKSQIKRCQKLQKISVCYADTRDLMEGIETLLLCLPNLRVLNCDREFLVKAIVKICQEQQELPKFQLRTVLDEYNPWHMNDDILSLLSKTCPFLTTLHITITYSGEIRGLESMLHLRELWFHWLGYFKNIALPFLQGTGKRLQCLHFSYCSYINFDIIAENCPNLRTLECFSMCRGKISDKCSFTNLRRLHVDLKNELWLGSVKWKPRACIILLSKCLQLRYVNLQCDSLTKEHVKEIISINPLSHLAAISLSSRTFSLIGTAEDLRTLCNC